MTELFNNKIDAYIILENANRFYFTGLETSFGAVILTFDKKIFITDFRYETFAKSELNDFDIIITKSADLYQNIDEILKKLNVKNIGYEDGEMTNAQYKDFKNALKDYHLKPASAIIMSRRLIKTQSEIEKIAAAQLITEKALKKVTGNLKAGMSEREVAAELVYEMMVLGAQRPAFNVIVAFGENAGRPHHTFTDRKLEKNDIILIDLGAKYMGYCSDMTRTFCLDTPKGSLESIYDIVKQAQSYALKFIKAGMTGHEADSLAREFITANGYGKEFGHSLGHGVGIKIHEQPNLRINSTDVLQENMVVTIEPGIYIEGQGGVRIEDLVVIKNNGIINLTTYDKELIL